MDSIEYQEKRRRNQNASCSGKTCCFACAGSSGKRVPADMDVYSVVEGDTLWSISLRFTGTPYNYPRIAGENRIADPDLIFPGQKIRLVKK